ncbi:MAG: hypothetical protein ACWGMZ_09540, partial [Thermoguttaceae bacterium]
MQKQSRRSLCSLGHKRTLKKLQICVSGAMPTLAVGMFFRKFTCSHKCGHGTQPLFQRAANPRRGFALILVLVVIAMLT